MNKIIREKETGNIAVITHDDHFWVNRETGFIIKNAFTYMYTEGIDKGKSFVLPLRLLNNLFDVLHEAPDGQG